jgi:apolipoprotein N-acyltransferase
MSEKQALLAGWAGRVSAMRGWRRRGLAFLLGALAGLALPPLFLFPLLVVGLTGLLWMIDRRRPALTSFSAGWWWGFGHFLVCFYWVSEALLVDPARFGWMIPFIMGGLAGGTALFIGFAALATRWFDYAGAAKVVAFAAAWTGAEWLRGHFLSGFPWDLAGYSVAFSDALNQYAALGGIWGLSLLVVAVAAMPATLGAGGRREGAVSVAVAALVALAVYAGGALRLAGDDGAMVPGTILRLVQPAIPETMKWVQGLGEQHVTLTRALTNKVAGIESIRAAIWPETAVPFLMERDPRLRQWLGAAVPAGALLITGAPRGEPLQGDLERVYNSLIAIDHDGNLLASADKFHLVPLGEYVPLRKLFPFLSKITPGSMDFTPGPGPRTLRLPGLPPVGVLICYEAIFPGGVVDAGSRPQWLLNLTNDAWFGTSTGPYQHFTSARLRSVEEGLPLLRVANTGISGLVDRYGRVIAEIPLGQSGVRDVPLPAALADPPPYARFGDWTLLAQLLIALSLAHILATRHNRN